MNAKETQKFIQSFADHYKQRDLRSPYEVEFDGDTLYFRFNDHPMTDNIRKWAIDWAKYFIENEMPPSVKRFVDAYSADVEDDWSECAVDFNFDGLNEAVGENTIKSGTVDVKTPFKTDYFDEDDGKVVVNVKPGTYEYRVLNINGWKPRQLKINGEWIDVMGLCKELEDELMSESKNIENETTTVSNVAPTVDYVGHVNLVLPDGSSADNADKDYLEVEKEKEDDVKKAAGDDAWISPLGRLVQGESVREVVGSLI